MNDIDYIAASFTRKASDVHDIRKYVKSLLTAANSKYPPDYPLPKIISKIESTEALDNFDEILEASDGIFMYYMYIYTIYIILYKCIVEVIRYFQILYDMYK